MKTRHPVELEGRRRVVMMSEVVLHGNPINRKGRIMSGRDLLVSKLNHEVEPRLCDRDIPMFGSWRLMFVRRARGIFFGGWGELEQSGLPASLKPPAFLTSGWKLKPRLAFS